MTHFTAVMRSNRLTKRTGKSQAYTLAVPAVADRVGVFGGTFDPPHFGHLAAALEVRHVLGLAKVLMVVANDPWQKSMCELVTPAELRLEMLRAAVSGIEGLEASATEIVRGGSSYTVDTLAQLRSGCPDAEFLLIVGSDAAAGLDTWKYPGELQRMATTVVARRAGRNDECAPDGWPAIYVDVPALEISSSDLRYRFAQGRPAEALVPATVIDVIRSRGLYGVRQFATL